MEQYTFHEGALPDGYAIDFEESLFNKHGHRMLQAADGWRSFFVLHRRLRSARAAVHFHISENIARSPLRNPFGSVEFSQALPPDILFEFLIFFEKRLMEKAVRAVVIKAPPNAYCPDQSSLLETFLINRNYTASAGTSSVLRVTEAPAEQGFSRSVRYNFRKAQNAGLAFREISSSQADQTFAAIENWGRAKGHTLSMDAAHLLRSVKAFPGNYIFFGVFRDDALVAAAVTVLVNERILYDYTHAHDPLSDRCSPAIVLIAGIYDYCQTHRVGLLDLGTSSERSGQPDFNLLYFKRSLGARAAVKLTFEKSL